MHHLLTFMSLAFCLMAYLLVRHQQKDLLNFERDLINVTNRSLSLSLKKAAVLSASQEYVFDRNMVRIASKGLSYHEHYGRGLLPATC